jgi:hypothetical protein
VQDIISLLFTSLFQIISTHKLQPDEIISVIKIGNFISKSEFYPKTFMNLYELKGYLFSMKKHSSLIYTNKLDLENLCPLDLIFYLEKNVKQCKKKYKIEKKLTPKKNHKHHADIINYLVSENFDFDKYTFWSDTKCKKLLRKIMSIDPKKLSEIIDSINSSSDLILVKNISNIKTFISIYK